MTIEQQLRDSIARQTEAVAVPVIDPQGVRALSRRNTTRRRVIAGAAAGALAATAFVVVQQFNSDRSDGAPVVDRSDLQKHPELPADVVVVTTDRRVVIDGHNGPVRAANFQGGAALTPQGVAYVDPTGIAYLIGPGGGQEALAYGAGPDGHRGSHGTMYYDWTAHDLVWSATRAGSVFVTSVDLDSREIVGQLTVPCHGDCAHRRLRGAAEGVVFLDIEERAWAWTPTAGQTLDGFRPVTMGASQIQAVGTGVVFMTGEQRFARGTDDPLPHMFRFLNADKPVHGKILISPDGRLAAQTTDGGKQFGDLEVRSLTGAPIESAAGLPQRGWYGWDTQSRLLVEPGGFGRDVRTVVRCDFATGQCPVVVGPTADFMLIVGGANTDDY
jgi:hypothetical protein